jgi:DNA (cytosine-5)-methyltransferase 1
MSRPLLLDTFAGGGGAAVGYHQAGFDVVGCDLTPSPRYPFSCWEDDALVVLDRLADGKSVRGYRLRDFAVIHASPPCQAYTSLASRDGRHPDLIIPVRKLLLSSGLPYVIENVTGAPLRSAIMLCGSMFGLGVRRHRLFESSVLLFVPDGCRHRKQGTIRAYYGKRGWCAWKGAENRIHSKERQTILYRGSPEESAADMGVDWMTWDELTQAIPPSYTMYLGKQLIATLEGGET